METDNSHIPEFTIGQTVTTGHISGYEYHLTAGKRYTVTDYSPPVRMENGYTFPAYVTVAGDDGRPVTAHTYRFKPITGE